MKRIYVAGKLNDMAVDYIKNMHNMMKTAEKIRKRGYAVFVPCLDILMGMQNGYWEYEDYFASNIAFLSVCDAVYVCHGSENSKGVQLEIKRARKLGIPVIYNLENLP